MIQVNTAAPPSGPAFSSWSGGKDSCLALHRAQAAGIEVRTLLSMFDESGLRSRSHAIPLAVMQRQADALGIALRTAHAGWADYEAVFIQQLQQLAGSGHRRGIFGDIDLQPHRDWEEKVCAAAGLQAELPLWQASRRVLVDEFLALGYRAVVVCVNGNALDASFCGRAFDAAFLADLPPEVDACGENGEFHTFVTDGPLFAQPVHVTLESIYSVTPETGAATYHFAVLR